MFRKRFHSEAENARLGKCRVETAPAAKDYRDKYGYCPDNS
jgi:hypothetical protein